MTIQRPLKKSEKEESSSKGATAYGNVKTKQSGKPNVGETAKKSESPKATPSGNVKTKRPMAAKSESKAPAKSESKASSPKKKGMSEFEKAFASARKEKGSSGTFEYKGKSYSTKIKGEK